MARIVRELRCIDSAFANRVLSGPELATQLAVNPDYLNPVSGYDFEGRPCSIGTVMKSRVVSDASFARAQRRGQPGVQTQRPVAIVLPPVASDPVPVAVAVAVPRPMNDPFGTPPPTPPRSAVAAAANAFVAFRDLFPAIFALEIQEGP